jgi:hypothetical protein
MKKTKKIDYEELGKMIETVYETAYVSRGRMMRMSFLKGVAAGVGSVVGATLVISLAVWILSQLNFLPGVEDIQEIIEKSQVIRP